MQAEIDTRASAIAHSGVTIARGSIHLPRELCDAFFPATDLAAMLMRDRRVFIVPLIAQSSGGLLLKTRNARGDKVLHVQEFLRQHGYADDAEPYRCAVEWQPEFAAVELLELR